MKTNFPGLSDLEVATSLARQFNAISKEFSPLQPSEIPHTYRRALPLLQVFEVVSRIRKIRKPKSIVEGDLFPELVMKFSYFIAIPLTDINNAITTTKIWPVIWKEEYVIVIPKTLMPTEIDHLRNISCTKLASKMYESYLLEWIRP